MTTNQPDSQAEDELRQIFEDLSVAVFKAAPDVIDRLMEDGLKRATAYAERLATKRAIEELSKVEPAAYVDEGYTMVKDRIKELKATLTKEAKQ